MSTTSRSPLDEIILSAPGTIVDIMNAALARNWGWVLLRGALGVVIGIIALVQPLATIGALVLLFAVYSTADGFVAIVSAIRAARADERWGWLLFQGVISLAAGAAALLMPVIAVTVFLFLLAFWAMFGGFALIFAAFRLKLDHGRWWLVLGGALSFLWGVLLLVQPVVGALVLTMWFGTYTLAFGVLFIILGFTLRRRHRLHLPLAVNA